jgi:hypothetical protein
MQVSEVDDKSKLKIESRVVGQISIAERTCTTVMLNIYPYISTRALYPTNHLTHYPRSNQQFSATRLHNLSLDRKLKRCPLSISTQHPAAAILRPSDPKTGNYCEAGSSNLVVSRYTADLELCRKINLMSDGKIRAK